MWLTECTDQQMYNHRVINNSTFVSETMDYWRLVKPVNKYIDEQTATICNSGLHTPCKTDGLQWKGTSTQNTAHWIHTKNVWTVTIKWNTTKYLKMTLIFTVIRKASTRVKYWWLSDLNIVIDCAAWNHNDNTLSNKLVQPTISCPDQPNISS